jgi:5-formyltetrahydrofolate cyclo-ligase
MNNVNEFDLVSYRKHLREVLIKKRMHMSLNEHIHANEIISINLSKLLDILDINVLAFYWPHKCEFNGLHMMDTLHKFRNIKICLPFVETRERPLKFLEWTPTTEMAFGKLEIPYPVNTSELSPDTLIIPMVGFDLSGHRLGYGGGYYDKTLSNIPQALKIGVAFELSRISNIFPQWHDISMDFIVTEKDIFQVTKQKLERVM